jgi:hypothetical protein
VRARGGRARAARAQARRGRARRATQQRVNLSVEALSHLDNRPSETFFKTLPPVRAALTYTRRARKSSNVERASRT